MTQTGPVREFEVNGLYRGDPRTDLRDDRTIEFQKMCEHPTRASLRFASRLVSGPKGWTMAEQARRRIRLGDAENALNLDLRPTDPAARGPSEVATGAAEGFPRFGALVPVRAITIAVLTSPPADSRIFADRRGSTPRAAATIRRARSLSLAEPLADPHPGSEDLSRGNQRRGRDLLSASFVAVPAFRRVEPARISGPTSKRTMISAERDNPAIGWP